MSEQPRPGHDAPILEATDVRKEFGDVVANADVDFTLRAGEIHSILGENGAGKSTFMKILYGVYQRTGGDLRVFDEPYAPASPAEALELGIGLVYQEFKLIPSFTVLDNVVLGLDDGDLYRDDAGAHRDGVATLSEKYGLGLGDKLDWRVSELSEGEKQRVELLKVLYRDVDVLLLDEPTSILTPQEVEQLFDVIHRLVELEDLGVVLITHKLDEALDVSDRITVLRDGSVVGETTPETATQESLAQLMVGREEVSLVERREASGEMGDPALAVDGVSVPNQYGQRALDDVSFDVHEGEIFGLVGVEGNGQRELTEVVAGFRSPDAGTLRVDGEPMGNASREALQRRGVLLVPDSHGVIESFTVPDNCILDDYEKYYDNFVRDDGKIMSATEAIVDEFGIKIPGMEATAAQLSGGNKQKIVLGRKLRNEARETTIAVNPTKGLDIDTKSFIHDRLVREREEGRAVLLITTDLEEALAISDTLAVINEGRITGRFDPDEATREEIGLAMTGRTDGGEARE